MTIQSKIHSFTKGKNKLTVYVDYYDDSDPDKILKRKCIEDKTIEGIKVKIEQSECEICSDHQSEVSLKSELDSFCNNRNKSKIKTTVLS